MQRKRPFPDAFPPDDCADISAGPENAGPAIGGSRESSGSDPSARGTAAELPGVLPDPRGGTGWRAAVRTQMNFLSTYCEDGAV